MATLTSPVAVKAASLGVLCVHNRYLEPGGEDRAFESESQLLAENGYRIEKIEGQNVYPDGFAGKIRAAIDCVWSREQHARFKNILRVGRPDLVHIHNFFPMLSPSVYYACREAGVPVLQTLHNYRLLCPAATFYRNGQVCEECIGNGPFHAVRYACYRDSRLATAAVAAMIEVHRRKNTWNEMVDCYIALTEYARSKMIAGGLPPEKIEVKPNFVFPDPGPKTGDGEYVLYVGRLADLKGVNTLLYAWGKLSQPIPLLVAGDGPQRAEMEKQVANFGLTTITFCGHLSRDQTVAAMKGARFLVFPSEWYEGFPLTIVEAFACGLPVICSRLGSMMEIVEEGSTGLHFTPGDAAGLAGKIEWAWNNVRETRSMGFAARAEFEAKYTAERNFRLLSAIYERVLAR